MNRRITCALILLCAPYCLTGCAVHRAPLVPNPGPNDPYLGTGTISGAGIRLMTTDAMIDLNDPCPDAGLCIGPADVNILVQGIEVYRTMVNGYDTVVIRGAHKRKTKKVNP